jgi:iron complex outermembrane receptor protein
MNRRGRFGIKNAGAIFWSGKPAIEPIYCNTLMRQSNAHRRSPLYLAISLFLAPLPTVAAVVPASLLTEMSFEELANIQITSVSKKAENLGDAAASVFVITAEDIRRSGATSLPEALRLAPNLQVAQSSGGGYAISARGLNGSNSSAPNKLLVLIDGRSVYTPLFSGVFWDVQDVMMEDIERIEVISGPGGTLWGVNAVNGVINVITRSAKDTQGGLVAAGAGNHENDVAFRYGGTLGADGSFRVYGKYFDRNHTSLESGGAVNDAMHKNQIGFRTDWDRSGDQFSILGNAYTGGENQAAPGSLAISGINLALGQISVSGANLTTHWTHALDGGSTLDFQAYYDRTSRTVPPLADETLDIVDLQFQYSMKQTGIHAFTWGANYRYSKDRVDNTSPYFAFLPADVNQTWGSLFAQDEIALRDDLKWTLGARMERNDYTGNEFLPNVRLAWKLASNDLLWAAASRTVRAPSRFDVDAHVPATPPFLLDGGSTVQSEVAKVYEVGYRGQPTSKISYSVTAFHTDYDRLRTQEINPAFTIVTYANEMEGKANGIEMWGNFQASQTWRLSGGYTALRERLQLKPGSNDVTAPNAAGKDPANTWQLRSAFNIVPNGELDMTIRHVAPLSNFVLPAYTVLDARLGWQLRRDLELSVTAKNLFGDHHAEYGPPAYRSVIAPSIFAKVVWRT